MNSRLEMALIGSVVVFALAIPSAQAQTNDYFPLEEGMHRAYSDILGVNAAVYITVMGTEMYHGAEVWVLRKDLVGNANPSYDFYSIAGDGDVLYHGDRVTNFSDELVERVIVPPHRLLDMPVSQGQTWTDNYEYHIYVDGVLDGTASGYSFSGETVATDSPVSVPAGDFTALEISGTRVIPGQIQYLNQWFVENNGIVRSETSFQGSPGTATYMLLDMPVDTETTSLGSLKSLYR